MGDQFVRVCGCGCGQPTRLASVSRSRYGHVKGQPVRFLPGHKKHEYEAVCAVESCEGRSFTAGLCQKHYTRRLRHGTLLGLRPRESAVIRFWMRVDRGSADACWPWTAARGDHGYGSFTDDAGRHVGAHRFSYQIHHGPIPAGLQVMHACDNPPCVNPSHLSVGTRSDNMRDMVAKGRHPRQRRAA